MKEKEDPTEIISVLVIDSKPLNHYAINKYYQVHKPGTTVTHCYTALEAIQLLRSSSRPPQLILLCLPPHHGGQQFLEHFDQLPDKISRKCRIVRLKAFADFSPDSFIPRSDP